VDASDSQEASEGEGSLLDTAFFERGFRDNFPALHRFIARRIGTPLADDLAAETFAVAFRRRASFDPQRGALRAWLFGIANNLVRNHWRTEQHLLGLDARLKVESALQESPWRSDDHLSASLLAPRIASALAALSRDQREVILLHAWAELTHEEIAFALRVAPGTVRSRLSRARTSLTRKLGSFDFDLWQFDDILEHDHEGIDHD
jgi:RNA polymerase sigma-70 factor (ECF subfamily)